MKNELKIAMIQRAMMRMPMGYRPNPLPVQAALNWLEIQDDLEVGLMTLEAVALGHPETFGGTGWVSIADRLVMQGKKTQVGVTKPKREKTPEDLQKEVIAKKDIKAKKDADGDAPEPEKAKAKPKAKTAKAAAEPVAQEKPDVELKEPEPEKVKAASATQGDADGGKEPKYFKGGNPVY